VPNFALSPASRRSQASGQREAGADRMPVDHRDRWLAHVVQQRGRAVVVVLLLYLFLVGQRGSAHHSLDVASGTERPPGAGQHYAVNLVIGCNCRKLLDELHHQLMAHRVEPVRPVERHHRGHHPVFPAIRFPMPSLAPLESQLTITGVPA